MTTTNKKEYFNAYYSGLAYVNDVAIRRRTTGEDDSEFMTIELGVRQGEKTPGNFQTSRLSAIVVGNQAKEICEAIMNVVDFSIDTIQSANEGEGRPSVSCTFRASNIRSSLYNEGEEVNHCLAGNLLKLEHIYIGGELFAPDRNETIAQLIGEQSASIQREVEIFLASVIGKSEVILDVSDPLLNEYVRALAQAGFKNKGNVLHWTAK